jgi:hypothetical protein
MGVAIAGGVKFAFCKTIQAVESVDTGKPRHRQPDLSTQNRNQYDSTAQFPVNDREPYYQDSDPVLNDEFDTWQTEEDFVPTNDVEP